MLNTGTTFLSMQMYVSPLVFWGTNFRLGLIVHIGLGSNRRRLAGFTRRFPKQLLEILRIIRKKQCLQKPASFRKIWRTETYENRKIQNSEARKSGLIEILFILIMRKKSKVNLEKIEHRLPSLRTANHTEKSGEKSEQKHARCRHVNDKKYDTRLT